MRRWQHDVSEEWLRERQAVLTATDVAGLLPEYKRYLKAADPDKLMPGFAAIWASKHSVADLDTSSPSPAAARGHIMEPWAVDSWNLQMPNKYYHWDDCIIVDDSNAVSIGFSPDAMNVEQTVPDAKLTVSQDGKFLMSHGKPVCDAPTSIMEIKSYEAPKHMKSVIKGRMDHDELMQLAMAFCVLPSLEEARLLWFCPGSAFSMHTEKYTRDDLCDQIKWAMEIADVYHKQSQLCAKLPQPTLTAGFTEQEIWDAYVAEQALENDSVFMLK